MNDRATKINRIKRDLEWEINESRGIKDDQFSSLGHYKEATIVHSHALRLKVALMGEYNLIVMQSIENLDQPGRRCMGDMAIRYSKAQCTKPLEESVSAYFKKENSQEYLLKVLR